MTQEQIDQTNAKRIHLDYAVLRYGDFSSVGSLFQLSTYLLSRVEFSVKKKILNYLVT